MGPDFRRWQSRRVYTALKAAVSSCVFRTNGQEEVKELRFSRSSGSPIAAPTCSPQWQCRALLIFVLWNLVVPGALHSQTQPPRRIYLPNIADEDWRFLADESLRADFWDPVKYLPLGKQDWSIGLSGEIRIRPDGLRIRSANGDPGRRDNYLLQRYLLGVDLRMGKRFRFFGELQSGIINGKGTSPRPTDKDLLDFHQGFIEYKSPQARDRSLMIRVGRQELTIGSSRLIAAAQGLNVKRSFDGASISYALRNWIAEAGVARLVKLNPGVLDDPPDSAQDFWGTVLGRRGFPFKTSTAGVYYLGLNRQVAQYDQGIGPEQRHTIGMKVAGALSRVDFSYDLICQWGRFQTYGIRSWAFASDTGYRLGKARTRRPRLGLSANHAAGDRDPADKSLESFNPLFPGNSYSGLVGLLGPTNLTDLTPSFRLPLRANLLIAFESPFYFRSSERDGIYGIGLRLLVSGQYSRERYVGANPGVVASWQTGRHILLTGVITRFLSGPFLKGTFVENGFGFYSAAVTYRF